MKRLTEFQFYLLTLQLSFANLPITSEQEKPLLDLISKLRDAYDKVLANRLLADESHAQNLIEIGADLGVFTVINLLLEGARLDQSMLQALSDLCAKHIEETTGMPAEDFALKVGPVVEQIIKEAKAKE